MAVSFGYIHTANYIMPYMSPLYSIMYPMLLRASVERLFIQYLQGFIAVVYVRLFISCDILSGGKADCKRVAGMHGETEKDNRISKKREGMGVYYNSLLIRYQKYHLPTLSLHLSPILKNLKSRSYYIYYSNPIS